MKLKSQLFSLMISPFLVGALFADSISAKKEKLSQNENSSSHIPFREINDELQNLRFSLKEIYQKSQELLTHGELSSTQFEDLLKESKTLKETLREKETAFRQLAQKPADEELFSLMHESEITLEQLILDYASSNYLYIIPSEMAKIQLNLCSSLPIPKATWEEIVELICAQNGIGIKPVNSFVKTLFWNLSNPISSLKYILFDTQNLDLIEPTQRVCFVLSLEGSEFAEVQQFLKRFVNERISSLHSFGQNLVLIGEACEIKELTKLVGFIRQQQKDKSYKLIPIDKMSADEMQAILSACFASFSGSTAANKTDVCPISIIPMKRYFLLLGSQKDLEKAENILLEIQTQVANPDQMTVYWYTCKYSEPHELAYLLQQVYQMMIQQIDEEDIENTVKIMQEPLSTPCGLRPGTIPPICNDAPQMFVNPPRAMPQENPKSFVPKEGFSNFIVDPKSGMIIMVVKQCYLEKLRELTKKLDIAKKMVQIEVLLFEKNICDQTQFGLNLFQLGDQSKSTDAGVNWKVDTLKSNSPGILDYFFGRKKIPNVFPAFNFAYHFLISQDDIYIHSNPTVTTVNQTPAVIDLIEEQSLNMGTVENPQTATITNTYIRAQYGTFIQITPTVNFGDEEDDFQHYITLDTNITFDTTTTSRDSRPNVNRRHIQNQVRIANGETLILGGLRRKNSEDHVDKIPFLGDIPGLGKLFSYTSLNDKSTEMFIFITPRVIEDPISDFEKFKSIDLKKRPGDTPELLKKLLEAKLADHEKKYRLSLKQLFTHA